ncbi:MAG: fold metallo-hydrolase, partial [Solirubrobacterales bacterium]|nr:fold metallo-hydrolase [Solirubrobacterales bacterium]
RAVLVDTGPPDGPVLERLRQAGVRALDVLVVTHAQADHDGAAAAVLGALPVGHVVDGRDGVASALGAAFAAEARRRRVPMTPGRAGLVLRVGALSLTVLSPGDGPPSGVTGADPNERAVVLQASVSRPRGEEARVLLTADAESDVLRRLDLGPVDVLKVAHHGSADPGLPGLLERLDPLVAGIEVGAGNTYGHPAPSTLQALREVPQTVRTDRDGSARADLGPAGWTVTRGGGR